MPGSPTDERPHSDNPDPNNPNSASTVGREKGQGSPSAQANEPRQPLPTPTESVAMVPHEGPASQPSAQTVAEGVEEETELPTRFGRYRIRSRLGVGGFGVVYHGFDEELQREVAIKVPHRRRIVSPEDIDAYLTEGRILAGLDHPAIVPIYDVGRTDDGLCYLVSKLIPGCNLSQQVRRGRLPREESVALIVAIAEALHYAHQHGLVHRDVKPANILLDEQGRAVIADFGLALRDEDYGTGPVYAGTPLYMSPEQARGEGHRVDARSDVYSLGVVFYELLAGQRPFSATDKIALLEEVRNREPPSPRQIEETIPHELERICIKAISKRAADRYSTALDLADELRHWLAEQTQPTGGTPVPPDAPVSPDAPMGPARLVGPASRRSANAEASDKSWIVVAPRGLRPFDSEDADFFLHLLPGPRGRLGLPDSLRFWKTRLEEMDPDRAIRVGLLYGPSGCGKSSLVKAGLIPRLDRHILPVYVEATPDDTETRLLRALRRNCTGLPDGLGLVDTLALLRRGKGFSEGRKVVVLLDQFEQWLHAHREPAGAELTRALRQCDGRRVQCVLMVRDDFWMSVTRFLRELEIPLREGDNSAAVDLFDLKHARRVLRGFGRAFGALPEGAPSPEQTRFLDRAVAELAQDGKIVPVRLALFAEMVKGKPWTPATLKALGGTQGIGVAFLEEMFGGVSAPPEHRHHERAARAVLQTLLPAEGSEIKGQMKSYAELLAASGYATQPQEFDALLRILDAELRLVTPAPLGVEGELFPPPSTLHPPPIERYYQLSHDYLVGVLRRWLTVKQRETRRGRAELRLEEHAALWSARPHPRYLPSLGEWAGIVMWTSRSRWTDARGAMMRAATRHHLVRAAGVAALLIVLALAGALLRRQFIEHRDEELATVAVQHLLHAETSEVPGILPDLARHRRFVLPLLHAVAHDPERAGRERLHACLALLPDEPDLAEYVADAGLEAEPGQMLVLGSALLPFREKLRKRLWGPMEDRRTSAGRRLRAACLLAQLAPDAPRWAEVAALTAADLTDANPVYSDHWMQALRPLRRWLVRPLAAVFRNRAASETARALAASILADYAAEDTPLLVSLIADAVDPQSLRLFVPALQRDRQRAVALLSAELERQPVAEWNEAARPAWPPLPIEVKDALEKAHGEVYERFAFAQALPLADLQMLARPLTRAGYRPCCFRPFASPEGVRAAVVWLRDERKWDWIYGVAPEEVRTRDSAARAKGLLPVDVAAYSAEPGMPPSFAALWTTPDDDLQDASLYVDVPEDQHPKYWQPLNARDFVPHTNLTTFGSSGDSRRSSVRWKFRRFAPMYRDKWQMDEPSYTHQLAAGWYQADVRLTPLLHGERTSYEAVWWNGGIGRRTRETHGLSLVDHRKRCRELAAEGYRPLSLAVAWNTADKRMKTASVWHQPVPSEEAKDALARRQAASAVALLQLGAAEDVWPLLRQQPDPRLRTWLLHLLAPADTDPRLLLARLDDESNVSARRALLLALAAYADTATGTASAGPATKAAAALYRNDADAGIHSAAWYLLRKFGQQKLLDKLDRDLAAGPAAERRWLRNGQGQTLAVLAGPVVFSMGTPDDEAGPRYDRRIELRRQVRIDRSFAIGTTEVTVEQFLRFRPEKDFPADYTPEPTCPATMVSWYDAVAYCRWLSEQEGIAEEQMCYPSVEEIERCKDDRRAPPLPADFLSRKGYRLPTEAEWEYACRANATTSRPFGYSDSLLSLYAWTSNNSAYRAAPIGRLQPNDFGLFDTLGNAMEWCHGYFRTYRCIPGKTWPDDEEGTDGVDSNRRVRRGGSFLHQPSDARSAQRDPCPPTGVHPFQGFRIVRTVDRPAPPHVPEP